VPLRSTRTVIAIAFAVALSACTAPSIHSGGQGLYPERNEVPIASNFQTSAQFKLQAAEHWRRVAYDSAEGLIKSIRSGGACIPKSTCVSLYLRRSCETTGCRPRSCDTTFNQVFFNELLTALVELGYEVSTTPGANAAVVDIDVQAVRFAANRPQYRYAGRPLEVGPGIWALEDATSLVDSQGNAAPRTTGFDANWYRAEFASGATPRNELVITVSAISPQKTYLARNTKVYYTSDADSAHYFCEPTAGEASRPAVTTRTIPVTGDCSAGRCVDVQGRRP
jgi:hypothetical protein